jgi:hypothetical protein
MNYSVVGFDTFEDNRVVYIDIKPDDKLDEFRWDLSKTIRYYCTSPYCKDLGSFDLKRQFYFHATVAMNLTPDKFSCVKRYISNKAKPNYKLILLRATILKNSQILYEYDFMLNRLLNRGEANSWRVLTQTFRAVEKYLEEDKTQTADKKEYTLLPGSINKIPKKLSLIDKIKLFFGIK